MTLHARDGNFYVLDWHTGECLYQAASLAQAKGFADGMDGPCRIAAGCELHNATECAYVINLVDETTGQIVAHGPQVDLFDAVELLINLRVMLMPADRKEVLA